MNVGDTVPVTMQEFTVAEAIVEDISDGKATLLIPATRIIMGVRTSLTDLPETTPEVDRVLGGMVEEEAGTSEAQEQVNNAPPQQASGGTVVADDIGNGLSGIALDSSVLDD